MSRRTFFGIGAAALAGAGLAGCAPQKPVEQEVGVETPAQVNPSEYKPSFLTAPEAIEESSIVETVDVDVCVVGLGLAGVCALREAAEAGAKVIGIDKGADVGYRSGEFGTFGSKIHEQLGIEQPPTQEVVNELMRVMGN
ncbi:MAG: FAD-binding dehydrogenase, partial [Slackia sp.]|nr:FAD-binding dehydrogenase [Slackia sp.]